MIRPPVIKVRRDRPSTPDLHGTRLVSIGLSEFVAKKFHIREDDLLNTLLTQGFAQLGPYIFTFA